MLSTIQSIETQSETELSTTSKFFNHRRIQRRRCKIAAPFLLQARVASMMDERKLSLNEAIIRLEELFASLDNLHGTKGAELKLLKKMIKQKIIYKIYLNEKLKNTSKEINFQNSTERK